MIDNIKAKNFKIIEFIDINPKKGVTFIFGPNEAGKSTVMDIIETTLTGGKKILNPIRDNQDRAETCLTINGYQIKKVFTEKSVRLEVFKDGEKQTGGLGLIEDLVNTIGFDPNNFSRMNPKEQRKMLLQLLKIDFTQLDSDREKVYEDRRDIGAQIRNLPIFSINEREEAAILAEKNIVSYAELSDLYFKEKEKHETYLKAQELITNLCMDNKSMQEKIERNNKIIEEYKLVIDTNVNLEENKKQLEEAEINNQKIIKAKDLIKQDDNRVSLVKKYEEATAKIDKIDIYKANVVKTAKMPLPGLSVSDDCIMFDNRPFEQLSTSQKMKVSIAICLLLMDSNKEKVIMIREGNLLDDKSMDVINEMAKENDCYFFIEMVLDSNSEIPKQGILIQEGKIIAIDGEPIKNNG